MNWYDQVKPSRLYRLTYRAWFGSWNLNEDLAPVRKRVRITRPLLFNTKGRFGIYPVLYVVAFMIVAWYILIPIYIWLDPGLTRL